MGVALSVIPGSENEAISELLISSFYTKCFNYSLCECFILFFQVRFPLSSAILIQATKMIFIKLHNFNFSYLFSLQKIVRSVWGVIAFKLKMSRKLTVIAEALKNCYFTSKKCFFLCKLSRTCYVWAEKGFDNVGAFSSPWHLNLIN